jgi:cytochrome bd-type quinol oxidase subunit 2
MVTLATNKPCEIGIAATKFDQKGDISMNTDLLINIIAFTVLTFVWLGFGAALLFNRELLDKSWRLFRSWNILIQLFVALLVLPVVLGLWIWQARWPLWLRLLLVAGLAWTTEYTFFPRLLFG